MNLEEKITPATSIEPDLTITKSDGDITAVPGGTVVYTLTIQNLGSLDATGVVISETVPANATFDSASSTPGWDPAGTSYTIGTLVAGDTATIHYAVTVDSTWPAGLTEISNTATVTDDGANGVDPTPGDNSASDTTPIDAAPDIVVTKSDGGITTAPGGTVVYTLTIENVGNQDATGIVLTESVPANAMFNSVTSTPGWNLAGTSFNVGNLAAGASTTVIYAVNVVNPLPAGVTEIANTASAADDGSNGPDLNLTSNSATDTTPVIATADINITKSDGGATTVPGGTVTYTLIIQNVGNQAATGVIVSETVWANATFNSVASSVGWNAAGTSYTVGNLAAGAAIAIQYAVNVANPLPAGVTEISNTATAADDGTNGLDPTLANNTANDTTPVTATPDITISKSDGGVTATPGSVVTYTLTIRNVGNQDATGIVVTETVPANTTFNAGASTTGWNAGGTSFTVGTLAAGATATVLYTVTVNSPAPSGLTQIDNTASAADDGTNGVDATPGNNSSSDSTPVVLVPDITITKSDGGMIATPGSVVTYTLTVSNVGNEDATGVVVTEAVPVNATFNSGSSTAGWNAAGTSYTIGNLAAGASATIQYAITVNSTVPAGVTQISNTATAADDGSNGSDATPLNNTASDTTPVIAAPDIRIIKFDGGITTVPGGTVVYTLVIQNVGNQDATGVVVSETVPANATFNSVLSSSGWNAAGTSYSVGDLSAGATVAVTYAVTVASSLPAGITQITNTANVADDGANGADPTPGSNTSSDSTPVIAAPDVTIVKDDGGVTSLPGGTIVYTLTVRNVGNQDATGIVISEIVPANTTFNSASSTPGWNLAGTTFNLPTLAAGGTITIDYAVTVDNPLPPGVIVIDNTASVTDDGSNGSDPSPLNNTDSDVTPLGAATIGDLVWLDLNADGVHDSGEPRIANVQVQATWFGSDGNPGGGDDIGFMTFTDLTGAYSLSGLPAGNYRIDILPFTLPEPLVPTFDIDGIGTPHSSLRTLVAGETATDLDFGYAGTATIGDRIWYDRDLNGAQDAGEPGLVGVGITLTWAGPNGTIGDTDDEVFTTMTGTNGAYFFANLLAGAYRIDVNPATLPAGTTSTFDPDGGGDNTANLLVAPGSVNNNVDFGYAGSRTVGDRVWFDSNGNGVDDPGEPGLVRATVLLHYAGVDATFGTADDIELTTTTTTGGEYSFSSLPAGFYHSIVSAGLPVGLTPTFDHDDATPIVDGVANFTVSGVDRSEIDFGFTGSLSVGNLVFLDLDANGTADAGEPELYGVDVALIFAGADGIFGNSNDLTFTDTTDAGGLFQFDNLPSGLYRLAVDPVDLPTGVTPTFDGDGIATPHLSEFNLTATDLGQDFGYAGTGSIGDRVWNDLDNGGDQDAAEPGLNGVTIRLTWAGQDGIPGNTDDVVQTRVTAGDGNYQFDNLPAGPYTLAIDTATLTAGAIQTFDPDATLDNQTAVSLAAGQVRADLDFGYMHNGSIAGMVYEDRNASGTFDAGDVGIGSVSIRITGTTIGGVIVDFSVNTQPDGSYLIPGLAPGTYRIAETQPTGYLDKDETIGGFGAFPIGALDGNDAIKDIVIIPGANLTGYNFGEVLPSAIRGFVYVDRDNDGVKDPGESAIRLVTVRLIGTDDRGQVVSIPLLTDMSGRYAFDNLRPGTYTVIEVQPRVALDGRDTLGSPSFGATAFNDRFTSFVLTPGSISEGNNFGELPLNTQLGGWIYVDRNANGRKDVGEVGIGGIVVSLTGTNDLGQAVRRTVVTDVYGRYRFLQLRPGTYTLSEVHPAQFLDGIDTLGNAGGVRVNDSFRQISLGAGVVGDNYNFGERGLAPIAISKRMFMTPNMGLPISGTGFTRTNNAGTGGGVIVP